MKRVTGVVMGVVLAVACGCGDDGGTMRPDARMYDARVSTDAAVGIDAPVVDATPAADARADAMPAPDARVDAMPEPDAIPEPDATVDATPEPDATVDATPEPDATVDATPEPDATEVLGITSLDYVIAPRLGVLTVSGSAFLSATDVTIGGTSQPFTIVNDTTLTIDGIDVATALGTGDVVVVAGAAQSNALPVDIIEIVVAPSVVAIGSHPLVMITGLTVEAGNTAVSIGGVAQTVVNETASSFELATVAGSVAGYLSLELTSGTSVVAPLPIPVLTLVIAESDCDQPAVVINDDREFIELSAGIPDISLAGYVVVWFNGANDQVYRAIDLAPGAEATDASGLFLLGNPDVTPAPDIVFPPNTLQNGPDAIAIFQGTVADFPNTVAVDALPAGTYLIDALVYDTADPDDDVLLDALLGATNPGRLQINEGSSENTNSIARCAPGRLDARNFVVTTPSPGAVNTTPCP